MKKYIFEEEQNAMVSNENFIRLKGGYYFCGLTIRFNSTPGIYK